jgi:putative aminopeptidase FrvX
MAKRLPIEQEYLRETLLTLLKIPSPTGFTARIMECIADSLGELGLQAQPTVKGGLLAHWEGAAQDAPRAVTAHADTLGAMVKQIKPNGRLKLSSIGAFAWNTVEGEGCTLFTSAGKALRGALLLTKASGHIHGKEVSETERNDDTLELRLDERVRNEEQVKALGVAVGDCVAFDPRLETGPAGFIRSRHLDDKACIACILAAVRAMRQAGLQPVQQTVLHFSSHEETGHGAAGGLPQFLAELVALDIAPVGEGQTSDEFHTTICAKDSGGPYHQGLVRHLEQLARELEIPYRMDVFPHYGSDAEAFLRAGGDVRAALFGPGVDATHNYERTHIEALTATSQLLAAYLQD